MLHPDLNATQLGTVGEQLVRYKLLRWGYEAVMLEQGNDYDLLVVDPIIRIQVKSTCGIDKWRETPTYKFNTRKGFCQSGRYEEGSIDCFAFVALDIETVVFSEPVTTAGKRYHIDKFNKDSEYQTWLDIVENL